MTTGCTAATYGEHDYSQPPHNTPDDPRDAESDGCQTRTAHEPFPPCEHDCRYEIVMYQVGSHDWIRLLACAPCTASLRQSHHRLGPRGTAGIAKIHEIRT